MLLLCVDGDGNVVHASPTLFDDSQSTALELIKGNYFLSFQQSQQYRDYRKEIDAEENKKREEEAAKAQSKSKACNIL